MSFRKVLVAMLRAGLAALQADEPKPRPEPNPTDEEQAIILFTAMTWRGRPLSDERDFDGTATTAARRIGNEMVLRDALEKSIRRYSPRMRGQA